MKTFLKMIVAAIVAVFMACLLIMHGASDNAVIVTMFATVIAVSALLGVYDMPERTKHDTIRHKTGRNYGQAAIFVGTACVFMGTPQECDDLCDDLWHYGQQARVEMLTGEETSFNIL
jgi:hypothetical protein